MTQRSVRRSADRFIRREGRAVTLLAENATPDASTRRVALSPTAHSVTALVQGFSDDQIDGVNVKINDLLFMVSAVELDSLGIWPSSENWKIVDGTTTYDIAKVTPNQPGIGADAIDVEIHGNRQAAAV